MAPPPTKQGPYVIFCMPCRIDKLILLASKLGLGGGRFLAGDGPAADKMRNSKFKLIPSVAEGSWVIRQAVGNTPVLLGNKLTTKYFRGPKYFEVSVDVGSSTTAASVVNLVKGTTKSLVVDMAILIGESN
jgi:Protein ENHANCED DISEASE RESISTANCE 2, C-terminal